MFLFFSHIIVIQLIGCMVLILKSVLVIEIDQMDKTIMDQMLERTDQITTVQMPEIQIPIAETQAQPQFGIMLHSVQVMALDGAKITF